MCACQALRWKGRSTLVEDPCGKDWKGSSGGMQIVMVREDDV